MRRALVTAAVLGLTVLAPAHGRAPDRADDHRTTDHRQSVRHAVLPELEVRRLINGFRFPWDVQQLPSGSLLVTERNRARLSRVMHGQRRSVGFPSEDVWVAVETGLMSMAIDPAFRTNRRIYTCQGGTTATGHDVRVIAWRLIRRRVRRPQPLLVGIPASTGRHGGCRLLIDRETGALLVGTGDGGLVGNARNLDTLGGKVLRLNRRTGAPWPDNPWYADGGTRAYVYTFGHRNVQGLAQRKDGTIWSVEHGTYRDDEVNLLRPGGDYGWDPGPGYDETVPMTDHLLPGGQRDARWTSGWPTLATSGATWVKGDQWGVLDGTLAVAALKSQRLLFMKFDRSGVLRWVEAPEAAQQFGRLRSVTSAANGDLLVTTSNGGLDHLLRVSPC
jgi:glucose/arabinose dehydrogenase